MALTKELDGKGGMGQDEESLQKKMDEAESHGVLLLLTKLWANWQIEMTSGTDQVEAEEKQSQSYC